MTKGETETRQSAKPPRGSSGFLSAASGEAKTSQLGSRPRGKGFQRARHRLSQDDFRNLITVSSAAICCIELLQPVKCSLDEEAFVEALYAAPSRCLEASLTFALWAGHSTVDHVLGRSLSELLPREAGSPALFRRWRSLSLSTQGFEVELQCSPVWRRTCQSVVYGRISNERLTRIWVILRDITPQARSLKALSVAEKHYRSLVERPGFLFVRIRPDGTYEHMSTATQEALGVSLEEANVIPSTILKLVHPEDAARAQAFPDARKRSSPDILENEHRLRLRDGSYHWFHVQQLPKRNGDGDIDCYDLVAVDIEQQREMERRTERLASAAGLTDLFAGAIHDLNNFLAILDAQVRAAAAEARIEPTFLEPLKGASQVIASCQELVTQLLHAEPHGSDATKLLDVGAIVSATGLLLKHSIPKRITLKVAAVSSAFWVRGDAVRLQRAIINLALNARDVIEGVGEISIGVQCNEKGEVCVSVQDSGPGVPADVAGKLFQPFFSTKVHAGAHGLGLPTAKSIVESFGGHVSFRNPAVGGAEFLISLPSAEPPAEQHLYAPRQCLPNSEPTCLTIFCVEDLGDLRANLLHTLSNLGHLPVAFPDAESLMSHLSVSQKTPDIFIIDQNLPGQSGSSLARQLREDLPSSAIVFTSGALVSHETIPDEDCRYVKLNKPFSTGDLKNSLLCALRGKAVPSGS